MAMAGNLGVNRMPLTIITVMAGVSPHEFELLERTGIIDIIDQENIFPARRVVTASLNEAVARAQEWLDQRRGEVTDDK